MKNKVLFKIGGVSVDTRTLLTVAGVVAGVVAIKKYSEKKGKPVVKTDANQEIEESDMNYGNEVYMGYVDEGFMGVHGGDESMKFGGGRPIAFANAGGTDNAVYEPNFFNSDGSVPVATDEPNFANFYGVKSFMQSDMAIANPMAAQIATKRGILGRKRKKATDVDKSILFGAASKIKKARAKGMPIGFVPAPIQKRRRKGGFVKPVPMPPVPMIIPKGRP